MLGSCATASESSGLKLDSMSTFQDLRKSRLLAPREESRIAIDLVNYRGSQVSSEDRCNSAIVSAERYGHFGLRQSLAGVFSDAVSSPIFEPIDEHWVTEDGHPVAPEY